MQTYTHMHVQTHAHTQMYTHIIIHTLRYIIPFSDVIDWSLVSLDIDERQLLQVPHIVRSIPAKQLLSMRLQTQFIWDAYLSSIEKIIMTTIEVRLCYMPYMYQGLCFSMSVCVCVCVPNARGICHEITVNI